VRRSTIIQGTDAWFAARKHRITASVAAACLGRNPYQSSRDAWRKITGREQTPPNEFMLKGIAQEENIRQRYARTLGLDRALVLPGGFWTHDLFAWLAASPDGCIEPDGLVELKWCRAVRTELPDYHRVQCQVQMACCNRQWVDYFAWTCKDGEAPFMERLHRLDSTSEFSMLDQLRQWYEKYVVLDVCPPIKRRESLAEKRVKAGSVLWGFEP
jgi:putative phage-type endonuclease